MGKLLKQSVVSQLPYVYRSILKQSISSEEDDMGTKKESFGSKIWQISSSFSQHLEALAVLECLKFIKEKNLNNVIVEGDSKRLCSNVYRLPTRLHRRNLVLPSKTFTRWCKN
uniref:Uncharacterized protein n=1 Tax=Nelumbo nucifera TaxID=4432 RepID=A0A822XRR6_NELNU|nr:TPA_asm: hypothetical protein HUJ06_024175 [Nelumbo nucifera]